MRFKYFILNEGDPRLKDQDFLKSLGHQEHVNVVPAQIYRDGNPTGKYILSRVLGEIDSGRGLKIDLAIKTPPDIETEYDKSEIKAEVTRIKTVSIMDR